MAYPLSSIRNSTGSRPRQAWLMDSQNSPSLVAPSPELASTRLSPPGSSTRQASAHPTACTNWVPVADELLTICFAALAQCDGICRPPDDGSSAAPTA